MTAISLRKNWEFWPLRLGFGVKFVTICATWASGIAMINTLGQLGGIVSPVMVGLIRDSTGSTSLALHAIGALSLLAAVLLWFGLPEPLRQHYPELDEIANERQAAPTLFPLGSPGKTRRTTS